MLTIVNADDLGTSESINDKIFELMESGLVTSATIITNAPAFEHAVQQIWKFPQCSFGVHLNLTVFRPLTYSKTIEQILGDDGSLSTKLYDASFSGDLLEVLQKELFAQVQRAFDTGVPVSHFDSHHHIHTIPQLFFILKSLQRHFGIRKVRSTINLQPPSQQMSLLKSIKKKLFLIALRKIWSTRSPDGLCDLLDFYKKLEVGFHPRFRSIELMVHPGANDQHYTEEIELLKSNNWQRHFPKYAKLGSYHSL